MPPMSLNDTGSKEEPAYQLRQQWFYIVLVLFGWGMVPYLAKVADFPGGFTTFWVNVFSAIGVFLIMLAKGYLSQFAALKYYPRFVVLSVVWPLVYSLSYFSVIGASSGSMATLLNYLWPLFALLLLSRKMRIPPVGMVLAAVGFLGVSLTLFWEGNLKLVFGPLIFGLAIPLTQAYFNVATTDEEKYPGSLAWLLTFIGAVITVIGSAVFILFVENGDFLAGATFWSVLPLAFIGFVANGIGFFAFLRAGQLSKTPTMKVWFVLAMFLVPFVQVLFLFTGVERNISPIRIFGIAIVAVALLAFKLWEMRKPQ